MAYCENTTTKPTHPSIASSSPAAAPAAAATPVTNPCAGTKSSELPPVLRSMVLVDNVTPDCCLQLKSLGTIRGENSFVLGR